MLDATWLGSGHQTPITKGTNWPASPLAQWDSRLLTLHTPLLNSEFRAFQ
jgi:hypothetical protein